MLLGGSHQHRPWAALQGQSTGQEVSLCRVSASLLLLGGSHQHRPWAALQGQSTGQEDAWCTLATNFVSLASAINFASSWPTFASGGEIPSSKGGPLRHRHRVPSQGQIPGQDAACCMLVANFVSLSSTSLLLRGGSVRHRH